MTEERGWDVGGAASALCRIEHRSVITVPACIAHLDKDGVGQGKSCTINF